MLGRRFESPSVRFPAMRTMPVVGLSSPAMMCRSVDLPDPDGPTMPTISTALTVRVSPRTDCTGGSPG